MKPDPALVNAFADKLLRDASPPNVHRLVKQIADILLPESVPDFVVALATVRAASLGKGNESAVLMGAAFDQIVGTLEARLDRMLPTEAAE